MKHVLLWVLLLTAAGCGSKAEPPANTYKNDKYGFTIVPPAGWSQVTPETAAEFVNAHYARLPATIRDGFLYPSEGKTTWAVAWVKTNATESFYPVMSVTHNPVGLPKIGKEEVDKCRDIVSRKLAGAGWTKVHFEAQQAGDLHDVPYAWLEWYGTLEQRVLRSSEHMLSTKSSTHFVSFLAELGSWGPYQKEYGEFLYSFRSLATH